MILFLISVAKSDWRSKKATIQKKGQSNVLWKKNAKKGNSLLIHCCLIQNYFMLFHLTDHKMLCEIIMVESIKLPNS